MEIGALIKQQREAAGLSQRELAQRAGTSQPAVAKIEAGRTSPTVKTIQRLLAPLNQQLDLNTAYIDSGVDMTQIAAGLSMTPDQLLNRATTGAASIRRLQRETGAH